MTRLCLALLLLLPACATVHPYERAALQTRMMVGDSVLQATMDAHVDGTREAMRGAIGAGSTSCGCN